MNRTAQDAIEALARVVGPVFGVIAGEGEFFTAAPGEPAQDAKPLDPLPVTVDVRSIPADLLTFLTSLKVVIDGRPR